MVESICADLLEAPRNFETAALPYRLLFLDMDGDGDMDLAVAENDPLSKPQLEMFENPGNGLFVHRTTLPLPCYNQPVCGDFNQDGRLDLAQACSLSMTSGHLHTWLQTAPFTFEKHTLNLPFAARDLYLGNLDGQFGPDLIIPDDLAGLRVFAYLSSPNGSFVPGGEFQTESTYRDSNGDGTVEHYVMIDIRECVLADLNGDGLDDLLSSNLLSEEDNRSIRLRSLTKLLNLGAGRLGPFQFILDPVTTPHMMVGAFEGSLAVGDVDGDGDPDLIGLDVGDLLVFRKDGAGNFAPAVHFASGAVGRLPTRPILADVDGDKDLDVAMILPGKLPGAVTDRPTDRWVLLRNNGAGLFGPPEVYSAGAGILQLALVNIDRVVGPEAIALAADDHRFSINPNRGGQFLAPRVISIQHPNSGKHGTTPLDMVTGDFNGDGRPDLAITAGINPLPGLTPDAVIFLRGTAGGLDSTPGFLNVGGGVHRAVALRQPGSTATDLILAHTGHTLTGLSDGVSLVRAGIGAFPMSSSFLAIDSTPIDIAAIHLDEAPGAWLLSATV